MLTGIAIAAAAGAALVLQLRKFIQGYYWDRPFTPSRDLRGCVAVVTGANAGLGKATSQELASYGVKVIMACRSTMRGEEAARDIKARIPEADLEVWELDVSSIRSIDRFTAAAQKRFPHLDFLVNNAGVAWLPAAAPLTCQDTGVCTIFQTNFVGPAHLTQGLLPLLKAACASGSGRASRVVSVSSGAHTRASVGRSLEDINDRSSSLLGGKYGQSKLAQIMWTKELQRRIDTDTAGTLGDLRCVSVTPGWVRTPAFFSMLQGLPAALRVAAFLLTPLIMVISRSVKTGAQVIVMGCAGEVRGGAYYSNCLEKPSSGRHNISNDPERCAELWLLTEELISKASTTINNQG